MKRDPAARLAEVAERFGRDESLVPPLLALLEALAEPGSPTSVRDSRAAMDVHVADSLSALALPEVSSARRAADLGAGAGLPGLVLAAALPACEFALVESARRKAEWIRGTAERMGLRNVDVVWARAEEWAPGRESNDLVTARALAALPVLCEYAAPLLAPGGTLVCWKGTVPEDEEADGSAAAALMGLGKPRVVPVVPYPGSQRRALWSFPKVSPTPPGYPRRAGMAIKRPLTAPTQ